jgi:hypothetical protein
VHYQGRNDFESNDLFVGQENEALHMKLFELKHESEQTIEDLRGKVVQLRSTLDERTVTWQSDETSLTHRIQEVCIQRSF